MICPICNDSVALLTLLAAAGGSVEEACGSSNRLQVVHGAAHHAVHFHDRTSLMSLAEGLAAGKKMRQLKGGDSRKRICRSSTWACALPHKHLTF